MVQISNHLKLAMAFTAYFNANDYEKMGPILSPGFTDQIRPTTLNVPVVGKQAFLDRMKANTISYNLSQPLSQDIVEAEDVIYFYTTSHGRTLHGFPINNEHVVKLTFDNAGILGRSEFVNGQILATAFSQEATVAAATNLCPKT